MNKPPSASWNPDRQWADLFIATLVLVILLMLGSSARLRLARPPAPETQVTLDGRLEDLALAAPKVLRSLGHLPFPAPSIASAAAACRPGWDQALLAVHAGENGEKELGLTLARTAPGPAGEAFQRVWRQCYLGEGGRSNQGPPVEVRQALGDGYAARILEARLRARAGEDPLALEEAARRWATPRLMALGAVYAAGFLLFLAGLGFGLFLAFSPPHPHLLPTYRLSGRAVLIVLLGWFLTLMASGPVVALLLTHLPVLHPVALPLTYAFHAILGTSFLCRAEGVDLRTLWLRVVPDNPLRGMGPGLGFFALAFTAVTAVSLILSPLLRRAEPPQKELLDFMANLKGPLAVILLFLTVAVLAPVFEELLFRGFLLPWLGERLERRLGRRAGWLLALLITAVTFGAIHMQPYGLPTLSTLGFVLGLAFLRTGNLRTSILVHGLWNGGVFLAMRIMGS